MLWILHCINHPFLSLRTMNVKKKIKQTYLASNFKDVCNFDSNRFRRFMVFRNYDISCKMPNRWWLESFKRSKNGLAYANFAALKSSYLNITPLVTVKVTGVGECGKLCVDHSSCFSANVAAYFLHKEGGIFCELLPSDKYNNSHKFVFSWMFNHLSIKVGNDILT